MKAARKHRFDVRMAPTAVLLATLIVAPCVFAQGTAFTYQGQLNDGGTPVNGFYDFEFEVWNSAGGGAQVGGTIIETNVLVESGLFTVELDFGGGIFTGPDRWLQIGVQTNGGGGYTTLLPRTKFNSTPYAVRSISSLLADGVPAGSIGTVEIATSGVTASDIAANAVNSSEIATGAVGTSEVADGSLTTDDLNLASVDARYVEVAGDVMTGALDITDGVVPLLLRASSSPMIEMYDNSGRDAWIQSYFDDLYLGTDNPGTIHLYPNNTYVMTVDSTGKVGIDTTAPAVTLDVNGSQNIGDASDGIVNIGDSSSYHVTLDRNELHAKNGTNNATLYLNDFGGTVSIGAASFFAYEDGNVRIDSSTFAVDAAENRVGVRTTSPYTDLTVNGSVGFKNATTPMMYIYESGTINEPRAIAAHSPSYPNYGIFYDDSKDSIVIGSTGTNDPAMEVSTWGDYVMINTRTRASGYELSVDGQIACEEVLVQDSGSWPDYVFEEGYELLPLNEVEAHIQVNKRLPGIPSAEVVAEEGISVGAMQKRMMEKIEELTLYVIDQNKQLEAQQSRILELESQLQQVR